MQLSDYIQVIRFNYSRYTTVYQAKGNYTTTTIKLIIYIIYPVNLISNYHQDP